MLSSREWRILALLVISAFLNYIDRSNLSVGATDIQRELHINDYRLGQLLSAFFWTYAICLLIAGWVVDRFNVFWVLAAGFFLWSGATAITGFAQSFGVVFALRLFLGFGESAAYPAYSRILANHFPEHHRGFANAAIDAGAKTGPALGTLLGGLLMARYGWRAFFIALGLTSLVWLLPWILWMPKGTQAPARHERLAAPTVGQILRQPDAWWTSIGLFCSNYFWYFLITWLPPYLEKERHFPKAKMAVVGSISFLAMGLASIISGYLSDRWIASGGTPTRVRKTFAGVGLGVATVILPVAVVRNETIAMILLVIACASLGVYTSNLFAISQTLAGPAAAGKWTGLQNGLGNPAGVVAPWLTGWVVQETGEFYLAFLTAAAFVLAAGAAYVFGVGRIEPVHWDAPGRNLGTVAG